MLRKNNQAILKLNSNELHFVRHNMGDKVSATPTPKEATLPSHHPNIKLNIKK